MTSEPIELHAPGGGPEQAAEGVPAVQTDLASRVLAIKEGDTFLYSDTDGNLDDRKEFGLGLYHRDTRFLSHFLMNVSGVSRCCCPPRPSAPTCPTST